jgi:hypothetical protein
MMPVEMVEQQHAADYCRNGPPAAPNLDGGAADGIGQRLRRRAEMAAASAGP